MKIIITISASIRKGHLPAFTGEIHSYKCELQKIVRSGGDADYDVFDMEIIYSNNEQYRQFLAAISSAKNIYHIHSISNTLEENIAGGLLRVCGKMQIDTRHDYEMKVLGSTALIEEKIASGGGTPYSGISRSVGLITALRRRVEMAPGTILDRHVKMEKDAVILNRVSDLNGFPLIILFQQTEDLIKTIQGIEAGFSALRVLEIEDLDDITAYEQLVSDMTVPVLSRQYDEIPVNLLVELHHLLEKNSTTLNDNTIGIIGINIGVVRLTRLMHRLGCPRVLGYDNNEKLMLGFEKSGGLATTPENIFSNSDLILLFKNHFTIDEFNKIRSGQMIISLIDEEDLEKNIISEKGVKEYIPRDRIDSTLLFPGIVRGIVKSGKGIQHDEAAIDLSGKILKLMGPGRDGVQLFSDIHEKISDLF
jgi:hypothetical protein